jgi:hypothetical protein
MTARPNSEPLRVPTAEELDLRHRLHGLAQTVLAALEVGDLDEVSRALWAALEAMETRKAS